MLAMLRRLAPVTSLVLLAGCDLAADRHRSDVGPSRPAPQRITVLDGDTLIFEGKVVRIAGVDAPELGPWAKCWAEAALAGHAREELERQTHGLDPRDHWRLANPGTPDAQGRIRADLVSAGGESLADSLVANGYAARIDGTWDWCGTNADLHDPTQDEAPPRGPSLWWPGGATYDARAAD